MRLDLPICQLKRYMKIMRILKGTLPHFYGHLGALLVFNVGTKPRILTCEVNNVPIYMYILHVPRYIAPF